MARFVTQSLPTVRRAAVLGVAGVLVLVTGCTVNPVTGKSQLDLLGEAQEIRLGADLYPRYTESSLGQVPDQRLQEYVDNVGQRLAAVSHRPALPYQFNAVNDPVVNAYALPGGKISITRGLLSRFETEDELAAVLGHEIGHVTARHSAQQYTRSMLIQALLVGGEIYMDRKGVRNRQLYRFGGLVGAQLYLARYSRENERQSDDLAVDYMVGAGYNPRGVVKVMEVLMEQRQSQPGFLEQLFASHPLTENRLAAARARVAELPGGVADAPLQKGKYTERTAQVRKARPAYDRLAEARALLGQDQAGKARALLLESVNEWPGDGVLRAFLAITEAELKHPRMAMNNGKRAADAAPAVFFPQVIAGQIFLQEKRYAESLRYLDRADTVLPQVVSVVLLRGRALEGAGRRDEAIAAYREVTKMAPGTEAAQEANERLVALGAAQPAQAG